MELHVSLRFGGSVKGTTFSRIRLYLLIHVATILAPPNISYDLDKLIFSSEKRNGLTQTSEGECEDE